MIQLNQFLSLDTKELSERDASLFERDKKNLQKLLQMALEVELFTIPLYMSGMYSIEGYHQINTGNNFYQGRQWPGRAPKFFKFPEELCNDLKNIYRKKDNNEDYSAELEKIKQNPEYQEAINQEAFNKVFKVFIEEMLHLQIAANLCNAYGDKYKVNAKFTDNGLLNSDYSWKCYGDNKTVIPGIIDFKDLMPDKDKSNEIKVKLDALNEEQIKLFLAIESSEHDLQNKIDVKNREKYKHTIPFKENQNLDGIMFGSISGLYISIIMYLLIEYKDGRKLYKNAFQNDSIQRDHFNKIPSNNKVSEYPQLQTNLLGETQETITIEKLLRMIDGILDQGEGEPLYVLIYNIIKHFKEQSESPEEPSIKNLLSIKFDGDNAIQKYYLEVIDKIIKTEIESIAKWLDIKLPKTVFTAVSPDNQSDDSALEENHKSYDDKGKRIKSASAAARGGDNGKMDHYEIFAAVKKLIEDNKVTTWDLTHSKWKYDKSKRHEVNEDLHKDCSLNEKYNDLFWCKYYLIRNSKDYEENRKNYPQLPTADEIADAMNEVTGNKEKYKKLLSQATTGTFKGLLMGMEDYWSNSKGQFPSPAMGGSGDRMSICWALLGQTPDLSVAPDKKITKKNGFAEDHAQDYHACQGLYLPKENENELSSNHPWVKNGELGCAAPAVYHSCKGSNTCKSESGCGYVQAYEGGANCGASTGGNNYSDPVYISTPGANNCATTGGCAVPISALQMFPAPYGEEQLMKYKNPDGVEETINYQKGELVYDVAWKVYTKRYKFKFGRLPKKPNTNTLRLIFPPST